MAIRVYNRRGNISLKEKAMVRELEKAVNTLSQSDPDFKIEPANNISELEELYNKYAVTDVDYIESPEPIKDFSEKFSEKSSATDDKTDKVIDPFNRDEPIVRDYVLEEEFTDETTTSTKSSFDEPISFDESFSIPDGQNLGQKQIEQQGFSTENESEKEVKREPLNPAFNEMDSGKQRKKTKRFAKNIVNLTCDLLEFGFVWYTMKDISEAKLTEYEINDEMDLSLLIDMPNGQQATVKEFFLSQHKTIKEQSKIEDEDRDDLIDALTEVFLEKGIAPTATQDAMLVGARIVGLQFIKAFALVQSSNSILSQLRQMKKEEVEYEDYSTPPPPTTQQTKKSYSYETNETEISEKTEERPIFDKVAFDETMFKAEQSKE
jgi:hypothetical protein